MVVRSIEEKDYIVLSEMYKSFFPTHNIFSKSTDLAIAYLRKEALEREDFLILEENGGIKAALVLVLLGKSADNSHMRWKFRHFAFVDENSAKILLDEVENKVKKTTDTTKIELTIAENEKGVEFYKNNGYLVEGELKNHYRFGESCFILGKSFK